MPCAIPATEMLLSVVTDCVCVFCVHFLILPTHHSPLSTCVFVLHPLPSLHPTQPTKTTVCQPCFIIFRTLFQSKILPPLHHSPCSHSPSWFHTEAICSNADPISAYKKKTLSLRINIAKDTFNISLQQSCGTTATCVKIMIFNIDSKIPPCIFPLFFPLALLIRCTKRDD